MKTMKKFTFGMAVLLGVSLSFFSCAQDPETEYDRTGTAYGSVSAAVLQAAIDEAVAEGRAVTLSGVTISGGGSLNLKTANVRIVGTLDATGVTISAAQAAVSFDTGAAIEGASVIIGSETVFTEEKVGSDTKVVPPAESLPATAAEVGGVTAVQNLTLSSTATAIPASLTVYVYGTLTVEAASAAPSNDDAKVVAIGTVALTGTNATALATASAVDVTGATILYEGNTAVAVKLPDALKVFAFKVTGEGGVLKVTGGATSVEAAVTANNGYVEFVSAVVKAKITGKGRIRFADPGTGDGKATTFGDTSSISGNIIEFKYGLVTPGKEAAVTLSGAVSFPVGKTIAFGAAKGALKLEKGSTVTATPDSASGTDKAVLTADSGLTITGYDEATAVLTFLANGDLTAATKGIAFDGDVTFGGDLTLTAVPATFGGDAFFADGKKITLTTEASVITLKPGAELAHGAAANIPAVYSAIIANFSEEDDVTLTPADGTVLTFGANGTKSVTQSGAGAHGITIGGTATLVPSATYTVASGSGKAGTLTVDDGATLTIGAGLLAPLDAGTVGAGIDNDDASSSKLVLTGAAEKNGASLAGTGSVVAGGTTIVGGTNGFQAVGEGTVTIAADAIAASADTAVLTAVTGEDQPAITVAAGKTLTIAANTTVDLKGDSSTEVGSIVLTGDTEESGTNGGTLAFAATTSVVKTAGTANGSNNSAIENATITTVTLVDSGSTNYVLVSATGGDSGGTIKATVNKKDVTLNGKTKAGASD